MHRLRASLFVMLLASVFYPVLNVHAQTGTPPPVLPICPKTATPTSVIPTFVLPTFVLPTSGIVSTNTPCPDGALCPTATVFLPTNTATATALPTATPSMVWELLETPFPADTTGWKSQSSGFFTDLYINLGKSYTKTGWGDVPYYNYPTAVRQQTGTTQRLYFYAELTENMQGWTSGTFNTGDGGRVITSDTTLVRDAWSHWAEGVVTGYFDIQSGTQWKYLNWNIGSLLANVADGTYVGRWYLHLSPTVINLNSAMTPTPSVTATVTPGGPCQPDPGEGSVNGGGTVFTPPVIVSGSCFTIVPNLSMEVPSIVDWTVAEVPATIGIPGLEICTQYWSMNLSIFGFNVMNAISIIVGFVCAAIIYRTFQN